LDVRFWLLTHTQGRFCKRKSKQRGRLRGLPNSAYL
jgi:hypothetical protein